jgi:hypothetical protein
MCCCMEIISQTLCKNNLVSENVSMYVLFSGLYQVSVQFPIHEKRS